MEPQIEPELINPTDHWTPADELEENREDKGSPQDDMQRINCVLLENHPSHQNLDYYIEDERGPV